MSFETALRATEILLALAFIQHSAEHLINPHERLLFGLRIAACLLLVVGIATLPALVVLVGLSLWQLHMFQGAYNGGADRMGLLILWIITAAHLAPTLFWQELALGYLALQLILSYFISGRVKLTNPDWRSGQALGDVFAYSAYPVTENMRRLAGCPRLMWSASWSVMLFEVLFPVALLNEAALLIALTIGTVFHLANAVLFGLNRFLWIWIAAYPSLIWLQARLF